MSDKKYFSVCSKCYELTPHTNRLFRTEKCKYCEELTETNLGCIALSDFNSEAMTCVKGYSYRADTNEDIKSYLVKCANVECMKIIMKGRN